MFWKIIQIIQIFHQLLISFTIVLFIVYQPVNNNQIGNEMKRTHIDFTADESWQKYVFWFAKIWHSLINSMHCIARKCKTRLIVKAFFLLERLLTGIFDTFLNYSTMQRCASKATVILEFCNIKE